MVGSSWEHLEDGLERNLDGMVSAVGRLQEMALLMGDEVDRQNERLLRVEGATAIADSRVRQGKKILGSIV